MKFKEDLEQFLWWLHKSTGSLFHVTYEQGQKDQNLHPRSNHHPDNPQRILVHRLRFQLWSNSTMLEYQETNLPLCQIRKNDTQFHLHIILHSPQDQCLFFYLISNRARCSILPISQDSKLEIKNKLLCFYQCSLLQQYEYCSNF